MNMVKLISFYIFIQKEQLRTKTENKTMFYPSTHTHAHQSETVHEIKIRILCFSFFAVCVMPVCFSQRKEQRLCVYFCPHTNVIMMKMMMLTILFIFFGESRFVTYNLNLSMCVCVSLHKANLKCVYHVSCTH